jgi:hypothetical protein
LSIRPQTFAMCQSLRSICLPREVRTIYGGAFHNCTQLSMVTCDSSSTLELINREAFIGCLSLYAVCIPRSAANDSNIPRINRGQLDSTSVSSLDSRQFRGCQIGESDPTGFDDEFAVGYWSMLDDLLWGVSFHI